jgi:aspartate/methionine/tyrosine aminotransferase
LSLHHVGRRKASGRVASLRPSATVEMSERVRRDDVATAKAWLDEADVAVLPGSAFGRSGAGHLRLSLTPGDVELDEALERVARIGVVS